MKKMSLITVVLLSVQLGAMSPQLITERLDAALKNAMRGAPSTPRAKPTYYERVADVQCHVEQLSPEEKQFLKKRRAKTQPVLERFIQMPMVGDQTVTIGVCLSGGGYRSMILSLGYLIGLEAFGLLNACAYITSLSGSTWLVAPWITKGGLLNDYKKYLIQRAKDGVLDIKSMGNLSRFPYDTFAEHITAEYEKGGQPYSSVEIYGALLANALLAFTADPQKQHLSEQQTMIRDGNVPFPIYTAASIRKTAEQYIYDWYAFDPYMVSNIDNECSIPTWAFGRQFKDGISIDSAPEKSLGHLLGIFGSAFSINLKDIETKFYEMFMHDARTTQDPLKKFKYLAAASVIKIGSSIPVVSTLRAAPTQVFNPWFGLADISPWLIVKPYITLVDAGIDFNLPTPPLMQPHRKVDIIIIPDSSGRSDEIKGALNYAYRVYGIQYKRDTNFGSSLMHVYRPVHGTVAPVLVYFPLVQDAAVIKEGLQNPGLKKLAERVHLEKFDPQQCVTDGYCSMLNFNYTPQQIEQLSGYGEFIMRAHKEAFRTLVIDVARHKNEAAGARASVSSGISPLPFMNVRKGRRSR